MKILVAIPFHDQKRYAIEELLDWLRDFVIPQGSEVEILQRVHRGVYGEKDAVKTQRRFFQEYALKNDFTHLFFLGADTIPPLDVLPRLLAHPANVVGGVYYGRNQASNGNPFTAVAWRHSQPDFNTKDWLEAHPGLHLVDGMGMDCVLFTRKALEHFTYDYQVNDDDYPVYDQLKDEGIQIFLDSTIICKHYSDKNTYA